MIQRRQTLYLFLTLVCTLWCLSTSLCTLEPLSMGTGARVYNLFVRGVCGVQLTVWPLFVLLLLTAPVSVFAILAYKHRPVQARLCVGGIVLCVLWIIAFAWLVVLKLNAQVTFHPHVTLALPVVNIVLYALARHAIIKDEKLVKSIDRLR